MINFNQLRVFYEVAKSQKIIEASKRLCVTQPAVSAQIKLFEQSCNLCLFRRNGRRIVLTKSGYILLQLCHQFFDLGRKIEDSIKDLQEVKIGILEFGTTKTCVRYLMPPYINTFHALYPDVKFILDEGDSREMARSLLNFQNELVIVSKIEDLNGVKFEPFLKERILLFAAPDHPFAKKKKGILFHELEGQSIIMRDTGSGTHKIVKEAFIRRGMTPHMLLEISNVDCIKQIVEKGKDLSFLVHFALEEDVMKGQFQIIPILDETLYLDVYIGYLNDQPMSPAAKALLRILRESERMSDSSRVS
jgi:DNA-binding transcriptional LysR family regulator